MSASAMTLKHSLNRLADALHTDADRLREFAGLVDPEQDYSGSALDSNVLDLVMSVFNTSNLTGSAQTALSVANRMVAGE